MQSNPPYTIHRLIVVGACGGLSCPIQLILSNPACPMVVVPTVVPRLSDNKSCFRASGGLSHFVFEVGCEIDSEIHR
eukprot:8824907-Pyramimonas_sp.AAC.1